MSAALYQPLYLTLMAVIGLVVVYRQTSSTGYALQLKGTGFIFPLALSIILVFWIGLRPISGRYFGDTANYAVQYVLKGITLVSIDWHKEWIWQWLIMTCQTAKLSVNQFFLIVEAGYVLSALWAVKRLVPSSPFLGMLFVWLSLMYFSFGVNGIRNGLACHLLLLAFSYLLDSKYVAGTVICLVAFGIHRSVMLPIAAFVAAFFVVKDVKHAIYIWLASIVISLVAGDTFSNLFSSLGFDDRMRSYSKGGDMSQFSRSGFRWDFLLYSSAPVVMAWYVCVKHEVEENWYRVLAVTYCLSNAFWVLVIRAPFSNRFAYLSWFLYPIIIAYPLINMPVWEDQDKKTGYILLCYGAFTVIMNTLYW